MTYNMGYASGVKQETLNDPHTKEFFIKNLNQVLETLNNQQIDVLLLQEVDFNSKRTHYFNQLAYLQKELGWNYSAKVSSWKKFVPFMGIGKMNSGVAILSKYPITKHIYRTFIFKPTFSNKFLNFIYFPFVWKNPIQHVTIDYKNTLIHVFNVELEVWKRKYRVIQFDDLMNWIESQGWNKYIIIGGDLNFHAYIPLAGERIQDYLSAPFFYSIWQIIPGIQEAFINDKYTNQEIHKTITFPEFKKRLDFLFFSKEFRKKRSQVFSLKASDHLPVMVELDILK
ncbi:endonuclease/exonuclease/phosphatase family protein [Waterburya agarophytonicola K14]|uniref:Endonuclease/exonuclease/phosphatase family protein n=1 Tax=Waterburya agarophytonicola KI4 TaxID=2874699 RepID=A0A964FH31_9CYAN|nr:endonuclease/exonuclease/phosphatase family protein [Waterburya agarophytonicola]MCC0178736.1 endonuclease/exonuclease/phosphatase family protein [Waterburya agarophytonicola KI4]